MPAAQSEGHSLQQAAADIGSKLASRTRHVCCLLGAGASLAAGLPDVRGLQDAVLEAAEASARTHLKSLMKGRSLEEALTRLRRIAALLDENQTFDELDREAALELNQFITNEVIKALTKPTPNLDPFLALATWATGDFYSRPVELFTTNYDLLIETGLESKGTPYFDGFVGVYSGHFRADLVEPAVRAEALNLPSGFVRVWKLHGSISWASVDGGGRRRIERRGGPVKNGEIAAIYPSEEKYDDSRRVPFVVLMDRLRRALAEPETLLLVTGYSFGDQHINELIFDAAVQYPRSEYLVTCFGDIPTALDLAQTARNLTVLGRREGIIGGVRGDWRCPDPDGPISHVWNPGYGCLLGDFAHLATFLATSRGDDGRNALGGASPS